MGSSFSSSSEFPAQDSTAALTASSSNPPAKAAVSASSAQDPVLKNCWSCRVLSGSTLLGAGIACWGVIVLIDPKGKDHQDV
ncbi:rCG55214, isoform CRA_b [Rattus norvegicus]|uniref:RCG55214, isoform CRA_b n=1 Tax=Rattus norvegicus TaxID=10116 RepID=A6J818_RAT|nr:distal membrane-arm assembly complex protein 1 isoform X1 [Rattus norvegicus]EDM10489.1 rCG55214, isoform CRA_b [Rattus norvegicus]